MKRKLGPLPLWAWVLVAGGTIGILWYLRSNSGASSAPDASLPTTAGAPSGGGVDSGGSSSAGSGPSNDDLYAALLGISGQLAALPGGGQGLTDGGSDSPTQTWVGELGDVGAGISALHELFPEVFAHPAATSTTPTNAPLLTRPSAAHGGKAWLYRVSQSGKLIPIGPAPTSGGSGGAGHTTNSTHPPLSHPTRHVAEGHSSGHPAPTPHEGHTSGHPAPPKHKHKH